MTDDPRLPPTRPRQPPPPQTWQEMSLARQRDAQLLTSIEEAIGNPMLARVRRMAEIDAQDMIIIPGSLKKLC